MRQCLWTFVGWGLGSPLVLLIAAGGALGAGLAPASAPAVLASRQPATARSAYDNLDEGQLVEKLYELQMSDLLETLTQGYAGAGEEEGALRLLVAKKLSQADSTDDLAAREKLIDEAVAGLQKLVQLGGAASAEREVLKGFRDRLQLGMAEGLTRAAPYARRILLLQGSPADARKLQAMTAEALRTLDGLANQISAQADAWRGEWDMLVVGSVRRLEDLLRTVRYRSAWVRFYQALALDPELAPTGSDAADLEARRARLLKDVVATVAEFAESDSAGGVKYWALLLSGMAGRELGDLDAAASSLAKASAPEVEGEVQLQAVFELGKLAVQRGQWAQAEQQAAELRRRGQALFPLESAAGGAGVELQCCLLLNHLYARQAQAARPANAAQADALEAKSQRQLADYLGKYPQHQAALATLVGNRYAGRENLSGLSSVVVLSKAIDVARAGKPEGEKAARLFQEVLGRPDSAALGLRPLAMWGLATTLYTSLDRRLEAARWFYQLAKESPSDARALPAARNAVSILDARAAALRHAEQPVPAELHKELIGALDLLLTKWGSPGAPGEITAGYAFLLGREYGAVGRRDLAIQWYGRVPEGSEDYWPAQYNALAAGVESLQATKADPPRGQASAVDTVRREKARLLVADIKRFSDAARSKADAPGEPARKEEIARLGAEADFLVAVLMREELDQPSLAVDQVRGLPARWPGRKDVAERAQAFEIEVLLQQGETAKALAALDKFRSASPERADALVSLVVLAVRDRVESLADIPSRQAELAEWRKVYVDFARQSLQAVSSAPAERQYACKQMLAEALVETGEPQQARQRYEELRAARPPDSRNIEGLARARWLLKDYPGAMEGYQQVIAGLDVNQYPRQWWRAQLRLAQCAHEAFAGVPAQQQRLLVRLRQLRLENESFGGFAEPFRLLEEQVGRESKQAARAE